MAPFEKRSLLPPSLLGPPFEEGSTFAVKKLEMRVPHLRAITRCTGRVGQRGVGLVPADNSPPPPMSMSRWRL